MIGLTALFLTQILVMGCKKTEVVGETSDRVFAETEQSPKDSEERAVIQALPLAKRLTSRTVVLTYHDMVVERDKDAVWFDCTPQELTEQLDFLTQKGASFISLKELYDGLTGTSPLKAKSVLITFADNYQGFYSHAWPILRDRKIPVTLFVHTGHVGSQKGRPKMTWQTLKELSDSGLVEIQSQTVSHPANLTKLDAQTLAFEFSESKKAIEAEMGTECWAIAYPNGKFNPETARLAGTTGYLIGFTEEQVPAELAPDIFRVPRWVHTKWKQAWTTAN